LLESSVQHPPQCPELAAIDVSSGRMVTYSCVIVDSLMMTRLCYDG